MHSYKSWADISSKILRNRARHNRLGRSWVQCQSLQKQRTWARHERTRLTRATQWKLHYRYLAAESWRGPFDDFHRTFLSERDCSKPAAHPCIWCAPAPNNWTEQNSPCVGPTFAVPRFKGEHPPVTYVYKTYNAYNSLGNQKYGQVLFYSMAKWLIPPWGLEPRSANHISTDLIARPRSPYRKPRSEGIWSTRYQSH